ncbi:MAG: sensor histidine kinase [Oscillospiraceae bacterium]
MKLKFWGGRRGKNLSIKWKIFGFLLGFCLLLLVILWLFQTVFLDSFYKRIKMAQVEEETGNIVGYILAGDWETLQSEVFRRGDLYVEMWSQQGGSQTIPGNLPESLPQQLSDEEKLLLLQQTSENGGSLTTVMDLNTQKQPDFEGMDNSQHPGFPGGSTMTERFTGREKIICTRIVALDDGSEQLLLVSSDISPVTATVETLRIQLFYVTAIMVLLATAIALIMSKWVSQPIEQLNASAQLLRKGDYEVEFKKDGYREIAELAGTLDEAARELSKTEALRRELIANVSHDLRSPLTLIAGYAEMIRDIPGENTPENMQVIIDEAKRLTSLVNDLLDLSRLQSGTQEIYFEEINLTQTVRDIISRFAKFSEPEGFVVRFRYTQDVQVLADADRISQVVYNFLINAITHGCNEKLVEVRQILEKGRVILEVADTGDGISPEDLPNIWDRYYKADKVHRRAAAGTGLGLSIVKNILEQHPGVQFGVRSEVGKGSCFWFSLPIALPQE